MGSLSARFGWSILSSAPSPGKTQSRFAWLHWNCALAANCVYSAMGSGPRHPTQRARTRCLSPTTPAQKSAATFRSAGPCPERVLDLFTEFRNHTNGIPTNSGAGLLGALAHYGLDGIGIVEKDEMRDLVLRGGPWTDAEREAILDYCESDVDALARLLPAMLPNIDLPRALLRGRYMAAAARMERNGVPIDTESLGLLRQYLVGHSGSAHRRDRSRLWRVRRPDVQGRPIRRVARTK